MKKTGSSERTVDDFIHNILNSSSLDNEMKESFHRMKARNTQQPGQHLKQTVHSPRGGPRQTSTKTHSGHQTAHSGGSMPLWVTDEASMPLVYRQIYDVALRENNRLDTSTIYQIFLQSGLSNETLGMIWSHVNRTQPGQLVRMELNLALAIIAVFQRENRLQPIEYVLRFKEPPVPFFSNAGGNINQSGLAEGGTTSDSQIPLSQTSGQCSTTTASRNLLPGEPSCPPPSYQTAMAIQQEQLNMKKSTDAANEDQDIFGDFESFQSARATSSQQPTTLVTSSQQPTTLVTSSQQPTTIVTSSQQPTTLVTSSQQPTMHMTSSQQPKLLVTSSQQPKMLVTSSQQPTMHMTTLKDDESGVCVIPPRFDCATVLQPKDDTSQPNWADDATTWSQKTPVDSKDDEDWADFTSFQTPAPPVSTKAVIDLTTTIKKPPTTAPARNSKVKSSLSPCNTSTVHRPTHLPQPVDIDLPPSEERHDCVDRYAALRDDLCGMSASTTSEDMTDASTPSYDPAVSTSSSNEVPPSPDVPKQRIQPQDFDDFGEFQASSGPLPPLTTSTKPPPPVPTAADKLKDIFDSLEVHTPVVAAPVVLPSLPEPQEDLKPRAASDLLSNISSLAGDRYGCINDGGEDFAEEHLVDWKRCLDRCFVMLQEANTILSGVVDTGLLEEVLKTKQGCVYIDGLVEIYKVVLRIDYALHSFSVMSGDLDSKLVDIKSLWKNLGLIVSQLTEEKETASVTNPKTLPVSDLCGICLTSFPPSLPTINYGARSYHSSCANFWVNCLDLTLPVLCKPHLI